MTGKQIFIRSALTIALPFALIWALPRSCGAAFDQRSGMPGSKFAPTSRSIAI
jgi:hypothetical protein